MSKLKTTLSDGNTYRITFRYTGKFTYTDYLKIESGSKKGQPAIIDGYPVIERIVSDPFMTEVLIINDVNNVLLTKGFTIRRPDERHDRKLARAYALENLRGRVSDTDLDSILLAYSQRSAGNQNKATNS